MFEGWAWTYSFSMYNFSAEVSCSNSLLVTFLSAAKTIPSLDKMPIAVPACDIASSAYSTWYSRPSGEKIVVCRVSFPLEKSKMDYFTLESYLRDMITK